MDKLELSLNNKTGDQGIGQDNKDEEVETPENLAILRQRKMVLYKLGKLGVVCMHACGSECQLSTKVQVGL